MRASLLKKQCTSSIYSFSLWHDHFVSKATRNKITPALEKAREVREKSISVGSFFHVRPSSLKDFLFSCLSDDFWGVGGADCWRDDEHVREDFFREKRNPPFEKNLDSLYPLLFFPFSPTSLVITPHKNIFIQTAEEVHEQTNRVFTMFARSAVRMARYDVSPHLSKWWKGVRPDDGQVSSHNCYFAKKILGE